MGKIYKKAYQINCYECTKNGILAPHMVMNLFQQASQEQSDNLGRDLEYMKAHNIAWIMVKYDMHYYKYPQVGQKVWVETEAIFFKQFIAHRRFTLLDESGGVLAEAMTQWMVINIKTQAMERMENVPGLKIYEADGETEVSFRRLKKVQQWQGEKTISVQYLDLDYNNHVNHVRYFAWVYEILPIEILDTMTIKRSQIIYKRQGYFGDQICIKWVNIEENTYRFDICRNNGELLCQLEIVLEPQKNCGEE